MINKMKNSNRQKGSIGVALTFLATVGLLGIGYLGHKIDERIAIRIDNEREVVRQQLRDEMAAELEAAKLGAFRPSGYVGKLLTRLTEGGSESTFNTTPGTAPDGTSLTTAKIGDFIVITINPGAANEEKISASAVSVSGTTATWTVVNRGLSFTENAVVTANKKQHSIGETVIISDDDHYLNVQYPAVDSSATISGAWAFSTVPTATSDPTSGNDLARRSWILSNLPAGAVATDNVALASVAGETVATGTIVYYNRFDAEWYLADADTASTTYNVLLGIAQGAGTDGNSISNGVMISGRDTNQGSTLTSGQRLYLSNTAGATSTSVGTFPRLLGVVKDANEFYFDPAQLNEYGFFTNASTTSLVATNSTTTNATTTTLAINGVSYGFPSTSPTASSTLLGIDANRTVSFIYPPLLIADGATYSTAGTATTTVFTYTIPAGLLCATCGLKIEAQSFGTSAGNTQGWDIQFGSGSASTTLASDANAQGGADRSTVFFQGMIYNNSSLSSQHTTFTRADSADNVVTASSTPTAVNTGAQSYVSFRARAESGQTAGFRGISIWRLGQ